MTQKMKKLLILLLTLTACSDLVWAIAPDSLVTQAAHRPVMSSVEVRLGAASVRNTYLAPLLYNGPDLGLTHERLHRWKAPAWMSLQSLSGQMAMAEDRGAHSEQLSVRLRYRYGALCSFDIPRLTLMAGPYAGLDLGFDYNLKMGGSNNPATARVTANAGLQLMAAMPYRLWGRSCLASAQLQAPVVGYAMMPEYGASYYESFYLSHTEGLHHFTSLHNQQDLDLKLTTDVPMRLKGYRALRLGLGYHIETMQINRITTRFSSFEVIFGWTFQSIHPKFSAQGL